MRMITRTLTANQVVTLNFDPVKVNKLYNSCTRLLIFEEFSKLIFFWLSCCLSM